MEKRACIPLCIIVAVAVAVAAVPAYAADKAPPIVKAEAAGVSFELAFSGDEVEITMKAKTTGWIAFGLDPTRRMNGAAIVIGYVKDGKVFAEDHFGTSDISHRSDVSLGGTDDIISAEGAEDSGITTLRVRLPLSSKDSRDHAFTPGRHKLILAVGNVDNVASKHRAAATVEIDIPAP